MYPMKKLTSLLLVLVMLLSLSSLAVAEGDVKIVKVLSVDGNLPGIIEFFNSTHTDIQLEEVLVTGGWDGFAQKLPALIAANEAPGLAFCSANNVASYAYQGFLRDVTDLVNAELNMDDFVEGVFEAQAVDGRYYGVPYEIRVEQTWYDKDIFDAMGVTYPSSDWKEAWTTEEWKENLAKLVGTNPATGETIYGHTFQGNNWYFSQLQWLMPAYGLHKIFDEEGMPMWDTPECIAMMNDLVELYNNGLIVPRDVVSANGYLTLAANNQLAMYTGGTWNAAEFKDYNISPMPNPGGYGNFWIDTWCLFEGTADPEATWEVAKWLCSKEYWDWKLDYDTGCCLPIRADSYEEAKTKLWPWMAEEDRANLFQSVEAGVPSQANHVMSALNAASKELLDQVLTGGYANAEEVCKAVQEYWEDIINDEI